MDNKSVKNKSVKNKSGGKRKIPKNTPEDYQNVIVLNKVNI